ncbi:MAG: hypothetical protein ACYC61_29410 [Isosphaeraceae bacterium]
MHGENYSRGSYETVRPAGRDVPRHQLVLAGDGLAPAEGAPWITQEDLRTYAELRARQARLDKDIRARRAKLIRRLAADAPIERGAYRAELRSCSQRLLTPTRLAEILNDDEIEDLRERVEPTHRLELRVTCRG